MRGLDHFTAPENLAAQEIGKLALRVGGIDPGGFGDFGCGVGDDGARVGKDMPADGLARFIGGRGSEGAELSEFRKAYLHSDFFFRLARSGLDRAFAFF